MEGYPRRQASGKQQARAGVRISFVLAERSVLYSISCWETLPPAKSGEL